MDEIGKIRKKFLALRATFTERTRRLWAGAEAESLGRGGVAWVAAATGMAISTVRKGRDELRGHTPSDLVRERRRGGGRPRREDQDSGLAPMLDSLVNPATRGDPETPLRWTCKSLRVLARELTDANHPVGPNKVRQLLQAAGYSLQANAKTREGSSHPDRDAQFEFINAKAQSFMDRGFPVISVDAKKRERIGEHANLGREWNPKGKPLEVLTHDYFDSSGDKAIPYGIYDVDKNLGFVNVGTDHNTPAFAVRSIEKWWAKMGAKLYPDAKEVLITADAGGSNGVKSNVWKTLLQELADRTGLGIHVSHFPPGTSKWNKIEHRLFSFISLNWRGRPLATYETIIALIAATTTSKGLRVEAEMDSDKYPAGQRAKRHKVKALQLEKAEFHGEWNYVFRPRTSAQLQRAAILEAAAVEPVTQKERRARWRALIREQQLSGLSNRAFCRMKAINFNSFISARRAIAGPIRPRKPAPK
jgi:hypothetical protein